MTINLIPIPTKDFYALYGIVESSRLAIQPARQTLLKTARADSILQLKEDLKQWIAKAGGVSTGGNCTGGSNRIQSP